MLKNEYSFGPLIGVGTQARESYTYQGLTLRYKKFCIGSQGPRVNINFISVLTKFCLKNHDRCYVKEVNKKYHKLAGKEIDFHGHDKIKFNSQIN